MSKSSYVLFIYRPEQSGWCRGLPIHRGRDSHSLYFQQQAGAGFNIIMGGKHQYGSSIGCGCGAIWSSWLFCCAWGVMTGAPTVWVCRTLGGCWQGFAAVGGACDCCVVVVVIVSPLVVNSCCCWFGKFVWMLLLLWAMGQSHKLQRHSPSTPLFLPMFFSVVMYSEKNLSPVSAGKFLLWGKDNNNQLI